MQFELHFFDGAKEANLRSQKVGIDIVNIGNLEDLLIVVSIDEESGNLKVVVESLLQTLTKGEVRLFTGLHRSTPCDKCCKRGHFFNKKVKYCKSVR